MRPKIIKVEPISFGFRLKRLIDEHGYKSQKSFVQSFNEWLLQQNQFETPIKEKDLTRWIKGTVQPRDYRIEQFANFLEEDADFLKLKTHRRARGNHIDYSKFDANDDLQKQLKDAEQVERFLKYCELLGYKWEYIATNTETETVEVELIQDDKIITLEVPEKIPTEADLQITLPDGSIIEPTEAALQKFMETINHMIDYEFSKLKTQ